MKYINQRESFLKKYKSTELIKEDSGPFANDILWGDSLIGRLINSAIRKTVIANNLRQMGQVEQRLRDTFESMIGESVVNDFDDSEKKMYNNAVMFSFLNSLKTAVENDEPLVELKKITNACITKVEDDDDIEDKDDLLDQLNKWMEFLDSIANTQTNVNYNLYFQNFNALYNIFLQYLKIKPVKVEIGKEYKYDSGNGVETVKVISLRNPMNVGVDTKWFTTDDEVNKDSNGNDETLDPKDAFVVSKVNNKYPDNSSGKNVKISSLKEQVNSKEQVVVQKPQPITSIKLLYEYFMKDPNMLDDIGEFLKMSTEQQDESKFKNIIIDIYEKNLSQKEISDRLLYLYKVTNVKKDGSFDGLSEDMSIAIAKFNETMSKIVDLDNEAKSENINLLRYNSFMKLYEVSNSISKIQEWWNNNMDIEKWLLSKEDIEEVKSDLDKKLEQTKDSIIISDIDPVIEICKIFNRAQKLHTTQVIPSGRKAGKVSNMTFREYTSFGGGTPENAGASGGPYRNNKVFDNWYDTVMDILKNRRYQPIFNVGTRLKVGDDYIEKAGAYLAKFMRDMLDGDEFFKNGKSEQGAQAKFLDKYFGYKGDEKLDYNPENIKTEKSDVVKKAYRFVSEPIGYVQEKDLQGTFFAMDDNDKIRYFFINEIDSSNAYVYWSNSMLELRNQFFTADTKFEFTGGGEVNIKDGSGGETYRMKASKIKIASLMNTKGEINKTQWDDISFYKADVGDKVTNGQLEKDKWTAAKLYTMVSLSGTVVTKKDLRRFKISKKLPAQIMPSYNDTKWDAVEFK